MKIKYSHPNKRTKFKVPVINFYTDDGILLERLESPVSHPARHIRAYPDGELAQQINAIKAKWEAQGK